MSTTEGRSLGSASQGEKHTLPQLTYPLGVPSGMAAVTLTALTVLPIHAASRGSFNVPETVAIKNPSTAAGAIYLETSAVGTTPALSDTTGYPLAAGEGLVFDLIAGQAVYGYSVATGEARKVVLNK